MLDFINKWGNWDDSIVKEGKVQFAQVLIVVEILWSRVLTEKLFSILSDWQIKWVAL